MLNNSKPGNGPFSPDYHTGPGQALTNIDGFRAKGSTDTLSAMVVQERRSAWVHEE
jgi:hypothetical protein